MQRSDPLDMTIDFGLIVSTLVAGAAGAIAFLKWWITRIDTQEKEEKAALKLEREKEVERQDYLREQLAAEMQRRIDDLMKTVQMQSRLITHYMNHIKVLERQMIKGGIDVPEMKPPVGMEDYN